MIYYALSLGYVACMALSYGITFASFQREFPETAPGEYRSDMGFAIGLSFGGPLSLFVAVFMSGLCEHGLKFR